ncbi:hypothetical protein [Methanobacterium sp. SMA-27]|uniref:hypothetical protein n=1 Tax=Methanobacterium sp. SMA-27 TaxID=1495336 RepID=UPI001E3E991C|nr:hypothetical protein [Methanobacterium sp. SMA-27]
MVFAACYAGILISKTTSSTTLQLTNLLPLEAYNLTTGQHLVVTLGIFISLMAFLSVRGILTGKMIKNKFLIEYNLTNLKKKFIYLGKFT